MGQYLPLAQRCPGRKVRATASTNMAIPIVDARRRIVGWTAITPELRGAALFQPEAERILGTPIVAMYVRIENPDDAQRAGAPPRLAGRLALPRALQRMHAEGRLGRTGSAPGALGPRRQGIAARLQPRLRRADFLRRLTDGKTARSDARGGAPRRIRTDVTDVRGRRPGPLDDGGVALKV